MNRKQMLLAAKMVEQKCQNTDCELFSHCGCLGCSVFENHKPGCARFTQVMAGNDGVI
jgi:hypothetical protein